GVHDRPLPLRPHVADRFLAAQVDRGQVHLLHAPPGVQAGGEDRVVLGRGDSGVVERHVDRAVGVVRRAEGRGHVVRRRHVGVHVQSAGLGRGLLAGRVVDVDRHHVRTLGTEPPRRRQPDPAPGPRDDDRPSVEPHQSSVEIKTFLVSVKASGASGPSSRPRPDCLKPPNGVQYRTEECEFTDRLPLSTARATRMARPTSRVQIDPERPYGVSLAIAIASASSENGVTVTTGPNTSSVYARSSDPTGASTVGGYQNPGPEGACPRNATGAPSGTYEATCERCAAEISGPISVAADAGSPTATP